MKQFIKLALVVLLSVFLLKPTAPFNKQVSAQTPKPKVVKTAVLKEEVEPEAVEVPAPEPQVVEAPAPIIETVTFPTDCETYRPIIAKYSWNVDVAMNVMRVESGCNPNAQNLNDNHGVCIGSFGLFQISCHGGQIFNPEANIAAAWAKYQARGWQPWSFTTCKKIACY